MRICFTGLQKALCVGDASATVIELHNRVLFSRICSSLVSQAGVDAIEPYTLWDDNGVEIKPANRFLVVTSPLDLPWDDKSLASGLAMHIESLLFEDENARQAAEEAFFLLRSHLNSLALALDSEYVFEADWEVKRYLRTYGFGVELIDDEPLLDKLIKFMMLAKDALLGRPILFVNLKLFLSETELAQFYEQAFFAGLSILMLENVHDETNYCYETKLVVDQDFIESW